ncbi:MAG: right-handed parallel beta-helix repeat-containing protein [Bacteriovoracaceae bacterium]|nr:right-handed parallel beta-helix repeat-containing protein [Bacteriovoracaceae bacterium]
MKKLTRKNFLKLMVLAVGASQSKKLFASEANKAPLQNPKNTFLSGKTIKIKDLLLEDNSSIVGHGTIEIEAADAIKVKGKDVLIQNVSFVCKVPTKNQSSVIRMLEGCENLRVVNCEFRGMAYCVVKADINSSLDKNLTYKTPVNGFSFIGNLCDGFSRQLYLHNVQNLKITGNTFKNCLRDAIRLRQAVKSVIISENHFENIGESAGESADAIDTYWSGEELIISSNLIKGCAVHGLDLKGISPDAEGQTSKVLVLGNIIQNCGFSGILASSGAHVKGATNSVSKFQFRSNIISGCNINNKNPNDAAIFLRHGVRECIISQNQISNHNGHCVVIGNFEDKALQAQDLIVSENQITANSGSCLVSLGAKNMLINNNIFKHKKGHASIVAPDSYRKFKKTNFLEKDNLDSIINNKS